MGTEVTITEAATVLGISDQRVRTLCREQILMARKVGASWLIDEQSLLQYGLSTAHKIAEDHPSHTDKNNRPIVLSFFSGAMGLDIGLVKAGFDVRLACEVDKYCRQTIALNKPDIVLQREVRQSIAGAGWRLGGRPG